MVPRGRQSGRRCPLPGRRPNGRRTHQNSPFTLPLTGSSSFGDCTPSQQNNLVADLAAATVAAEAGVGGGTHENNARAWSCYTKYCNSIGLDGNYFLDGMPRQHRIAIMGAFAGLYVKGDFQDRVMVPWLKSQSKVPSTQWLRPSEKMDEKTPIGTQSATLGNFYSGN